MNLTFNSKSDLHCVKDYSYIRMPIPMSMRRFSNGCFTGFCQFRMEKEFAVEMRTLPDFAHVFLILGLLT